MPYGFVKTGPAFSRTAAISLRRRGATTVSTRSNSKIPAYSCAKTLGDKSVAVAAIIQNGDPFVMRSILLPQATGSSSDDGQSRVYFQNQWYQGSQGIEQVDMAYDLAMCQMGVDCGSDSNTALVMCSEKGWCGGSVQDAIQQQLNAEGAGKFGEVSQIASQILSQIKSGNASAFVHL